MADPMTQPTNFIDQDDALIHLLKSASDDVRFSDDLYRRIAHLSTTGGGSDLDFAVLCRQLLRRWSLRDGRNQYVTFAPSISARLRPVASAVDLREKDSDRWVADPWQPSWLDIGVPDFASAAGTALGKRFHSEGLAADPFFVQRTGFERYRTPGQRAACRAVVSMPPGSTLIAMLPTGSGKTEVALCLAERYKGAVTLLIVPTIALAYDFERRFRDHYARRNPRVDPSALHFAWTSDTSSELRDELLSRVRDGIQPLLVTSPESVTKALHTLLAESAAVGRVGGLVIDEAHLITQWGRDFRPEFRTLAHLRRELLALASDRNHPLPTTLLLSATLGASELADLHALFKEPGPCTLVAANALRAEPDLWIHSAEDESARQRHVLEALAHLPRPAVLYVTSPQTADDWLTRLTEFGYRRLAVVTGKTGGHERQEVLDGLRSATPSVDLVVATSAFGMGIDYPHIRTVVHACLPETVDRWYQEVGRGGRDGDVSVGMLLPAPGDWNEAKSLSTTVLGPDKARERWSDLWSHREKSADRIFVDIEGNRGVGKGSYNRRWNAQLVQGLDELGAINRIHTDVEDRAELPMRAETPREWVAVELRDNLTNTFWPEKWQPWQQTEHERSQRMFDAVTALADLSVSACWVIAEYYRPDDCVRELFGRSASEMEPLAPCGRCPGCRQLGVAPPDDPPPRPAQVWPLWAEIETRLEDLAAAASSSDGLILLTAEYPRRVASTLASALIARGVRHIAGPIDNIACDSDWMFRDLEPIGPLELTPCSSFVLYPQDSHVSGLWLSQKRRMANRMTGAPVFDVLLLARDTLINDRRVGRDLFALDAMTALELLGRGVN